jgi:hypothetical protein
MPGWLVSMVIHAVGLLILAILTVPDPMQRVANIITAAPPLENVEEIEEFEEELLTPLDVDVSTDFLGRCGTDGDDFQHGSRGCDSGGCVCGRRCGSDFGRSGGFRCRDSAPERPV